MQLLWGPTQKSKSKQQRCLVHAYSLYAGPPPPHCQTKKINCFGFCLLALLPSSHSLRDFSNNAFFRLLYRIVRCIWQTVQNRICDCGYRICELITNATSMLTCYATSLLSVIPSLLSYKSSLLSYTSSLLSYL